MHIEFKTDKCILTQETGGDGEQFADLFDDDMDDDMMIQASANAVEGGGEGLALDHLTPADSDDDDAMMPTLQKRQKALRLDDIDDNSRGKLTEWLFFQIELTIQFQN